MKFLQFIAFTLCLLILLPVHALAATPVDESIIYFDDGSYITITIQSTGVRSATTKVGYKIYEYVNAVGNTEWTATLNGYFSYDGTTCTCTYSSLTVDKLNSSWYIVSGGSEESGNSAIATLTMGYKVLGITTTKRTIDMAISCDANGNLS